MATTGFWPVKNRLKAAIDYAENPSKTTLSRAADPDLYAALEYAANDSKTDRRMFVSAINCPKQFACEHMMRTKEKYGKPGGNVAYHGYQSFKTGEVTPEEAHAIGLETARRMWGEDYEIVVTTHLNTDNIHNHMVVNSVSFRTGRKFENHVSDHYRLWEISDRVCEEHGISVLRGSDFYANRGRSYWAEQSGQKSHRQMLQEDIEKCLSMSFDRSVFWRHMDALGYTLLRGGGYAHPCITAPGWKRPVRLDKLGYSLEEIDYRLEQNVCDNRYTFVVMRNQRKAEKYTPLLSIEASIRTAQNMDGLRLTFAILLELLRLITGRPGLDPVKPLSPTLRMEITKLDKTLKQYQFLIDHRIDSVAVLSTFTADTEKKIGALETQRQKLYHRIRRPKSEEEKEQSKALARDTSAEIRPLRKELAIAKEIAARYPQVQELLNTERVMEQEVLTRNRKRGYER